MVASRGKFTFTRTEAQFSPDGASLISHTGYRRLPGFPSVPEELQATWREPDELALHGMLTPWDLGMRSEADMIHVKNLESTYPLVRWTDQWETQW